MSRTEARGKILFCSLLALVAGGCASVKTERAVMSGNNSSVKQENPVERPAYSGPKKRIQVISFGLPKEVLEKYPDLANRKVGFGLASRIVEGLWDTKRFEFIEDRSEVLQKMVEQWERSAAGLVSEETAVEAGGLKAPEYLVYAEVFDFGINRSEEVKGLRVKGTDITMIGIQIRFVDVKTGEFYPGSAIGEAKTEGVGTWVSPELEFNQTTVGLASQDAVNKALDQLIKRLPM